MSQTLNKLASEPKSESNYLCLNNLWGYKGNIVRPGIEKSVYHKENRKRENPGSKDYVW